MRLDDESVGGTVDPEVRPIHAQCLGVVDVDDLEFVAIGDVEHLVHGLVDDVADETATLGLDVVRKVDSDERHWESL